MLGRKSPAGDTPDAAHDARQPTLSHHAKPERMRAAGTLELPAGPSLCWMGLLLLAASNDVDDHTPQNVDHTDGRTKVQDDLHFNGVLAGRQT